MTKTLFRNFLLTLVIVTTACSSSRWVVEDQYATDRSDFELLDSQYYLERSGTTTPQSPIVSYDLIAANTYEYAQRVQTDRYIQDYRPSWKSILIGLAGAGIATTAALKASDNEHATTSTVLFATAGVIATASVLNLKPNGDPTPTGESRLLRRTGTITETQLVDAQPVESINPSYAIYHNNDAIVLNNSVTFSNSLYSINLIEEINPIDFSYDSSDFIRLEVYFNDTTYIEQIPLKSIFERFVVVSSEVTALRDEPVLDSRNVLTDLARGSQLKLVSEDDSWYRVLYGISETWISKNDAYPIWRPSAFASQLSIIAVPNIPFGNVDVESNIPVLRERNDSTFVFNLANREYQGDLSERIYAERDSRLMEEYMETALGVPAENIFRALNVENQRQLTIAYNRLANNIRGEQKRLFVFISGYVETGENGEAILLGTGQGSPINLRAFLEGLSNLPVQEIIVFADLDNIGANREEAMILSLGEEFIANKPNSAIIFGAAENQRSRDYSTPQGDQKRHSIFTYFVADAIKNGQTTISGIVNHLQRNVDYTSRRLHNQPQNVIYFGNADINLIR